MAQTSRALPVVFALVAIAAGILLWRIFAPPGPGAFALWPIRFADLPGWQLSDPAPALAAYRRSCAALEKKQAGAPMGGVGYAGTVGDWRPACAAAAGAKDAKAFFETYFTPVAISSGGVQEGLFTGYYEPEILASRARHGAYRTPVYGMPDDLVSVDLGQFRPEWKDRKIAGRLDGHRLVPYPDRAAIDAQGVRSAKILFYAKDPVSVFFLHIQGSGRVGFDDGSAERVAYAGQNGQPYTAIGRTLIQEGAIAREKISLQSIRAWLLAHPKDAARVMETDRSFVFFREEPVADPALGAEGSEGVKLTPGASLAVDPKRHPLAAPFYIAATAPDPDPTKPDRPFDRLLIAQDTGGAIGGAIRGDVFWGFGKDAESIAGRMKAKGEMFVLLPKKLAAQLRGYKTFPDPGP